MGHKPGELGPEPKGYGELDSNITNMFQQFETQLCLDSSFKRIEDGIRRGRKLPARRQMIPKTIMMTIIMSICFTNFLHEVNVLPRVMQRKNLLT